MSYQELLSVLSDKFSVETIKEKDISFIQTHLNKKVVLNVLKDILGNSELLKKLPIGLILMHLVLIKLS